LVAEAEILVKESANFVVFDQKADPMIKDIESEGDHLEPPAIPFVRLYLRVRLAGINVKTVENP
jgi:hypothetical protein